MGTAVRRASVGCVLVAAVVVTGLFVGAQHPATAGSGQPASETELVLFWGDGCPVCEAEREFLAELSADHPGLVVRDYEVWRDEANAARFEATMADLGLEARAVPTTIVGDRVWVGFDDAVAAEIDEAVAGPGPDADSARTTLEVPFFGTVDVGGRSLLWSTVIIGFVDGVNPCSLWVLSVLLALVLHSGSRRRVLAVGGVFLVVTSAMYGLYIAGVWGALTVAGSLPWIQRGAALVVGALGLLQLRVLAGPDQAGVPGISGAARPGLYRRMRELAAPERRWPVVLAATAALAVLVSVLETPCTLGLPILWTDLLAAAEVGPAGAAVLFVVYLGVFLVDELVLFAIVVFTMRAVRLQERHGRELRVVSGVVMLALAVVLLTAPEVMEQVTGALTVFAAAGAAAALVLLADRRVHRRPLAP